ncbi:hypothetical protein AB0M44_13120 [Streptosporangium subroseum]|uniref:hypothetical protein n=1 Tax=Streptosporangium subroseum TaxID=106412 RepID=UPI00344245F6
MADVLVVPVRLAALYLEDEVGVVEPVDFTRLPYVDPVTKRDVRPGTPYIGEEILPDPFEDQDFLLGPGVHLYWSLPDALTRLVQQDGRTRVPGVPYRYLVPDERLLPVETIRFLQLDPQWIAHLLDGATSIGRITRADADRDRMRPPLPLLRSERLSPTVLLCLFRGVLGRLDLRQPPEEQHFGVEPPSDGRVSGRFGKTLRAADGSQGPSIPSLALGASGTVPVTALTNAMATALAVQASAFDSAAFARQMIETAERVTFLRT